MVAITECELLESEVALLLNFELSFIWGRYSYAYR